MIFNDIFTAYITYTSVEMNTSPNVVDKFDLEVEIQLETRLDLNKIKTVDLQKRRNVAIDE